nr:hypothetical protein [Candidatus Njordarchaeota archaeon]
MLHRYPTGGTYGAGNMTIGIVAPDACPKNMTLLFGGAPVKTWNYSTSATYK